VAWTNTKGSVSGLLRDSLLKRRSREMQSDDVYYFGW
jgi:hypothetical protein